MIFADWIEMDERAVLALESIAESLKSIDHLALESAESLKSIAESAESLKGIDHRVGRVAEELDEIETSISQAYRHWMEHYAPKKKKK